MKVYFHGTSLVHRIYVSPGVDHPDVSEWVGENRKPKQFEILFMNGQAEVDDKLGEYLIEKGLASKSKIIYEKKRSFIQ